MSVPYDLQSVPSTIKPLRSDFRWSPDLIDFSRHDAYAEQFRQRSLGRRVKAMGAYASRFALLLAKRLIRYEMIPIEYRKGRDLGSRLGFLSYAARNAFDFSRLGGRKSRAPATDLDKAFNERGIVALVMAPERFQELQGLARPFFDKLEARRGQGANRREFMDSRGVTGRNVAPDLYAKIDQILIESGLKATAENYLGRPVQLVDVNPQINDRSDSFWREVYTDIPDRQLSKTAYLHLDASGGDLKVIFYFSPVGETNGPFSYAIGSNRMKLSLVDNLLAEANDHNGLSLTTPEARETFSALPRKLQQKGLFGNDLPDDSPASREIVDALWQVTGPAGSIVMFDTKGMHRGGMVEDGERRVLTCVLG